MKKFKLAKSVEIKEYYRCWCCGEKLEARIATHEIRVFYSNYTGIVQVDMPITCHDCRVSFEEWFRSRIYSNKKVHPEINKKRNKEIKNG